MKSYHQKFVSETPLEVYPTGEISGFPVSPGMFDLNGATPLQNGVNFTIHTCGGTACELLLFHREEEEPFAVLPFPEAARPSLLSRRRRPASRPAKNALHPEEKFLCL